MAGQGHWEIIELHSKSRSQTDSHDHSHGHSNGHADGQPDSKVDIVAVHMAMLRTGKVLLFSAVHAKEWDIDDGESALFDPADPHDTMEPKIKRNLFCCGHSILPDGRLFVAGGQNTAQIWWQYALSYLGLLRGADHDLHIFDPDTEEWTKLDVEMPDARWYPTCATLPDGRVIITSGLKVGVIPTKVNETVEYYDPVSNSLSKQKPFWEGIGVYPFVHVLPGDYLFVHSEQTTRLFNWKTETWFEKEFKINHQGTRTYRGQGSCVVLPIDQNGRDVYEQDRVRIMVMGGSSSLTPDEETPAVPHVEIFEFYPDDPAKSGWVHGAPLNCNRFMSDSIILPDGCVLICSGAKAGQADHNKDSANEAQLYFPETGEWADMMHAGVDRLYHATAALLPDGRVMTGGSTGHDWPPSNNEFRLEIFTPPNLLRVDSDGNEVERERPVIGSAPPELKYGESITIDTPNASQIRSAALIRPSTTTHTINMDQRCVRLEITNRTENQLTLAGPIDGSVAPPTSYMLFIVDENGTPSISKFVKVH